MHKSNQTKFFLPLLIILLIVGGFCLRNQKGLPEVSAANDCVSGGGVTCTKTIYGQYTINTYTISGNTTGSTTWTVPTGVTQVEYLVVGGGGGGGSTTGGGGGAGGLLTNYGGTKLAVSGVIPVTVGAGGAGGTAAWNNGVNGDNSVFSSITATGGGGGASNNPAGSNGGSGGGGSNGLAGGTGIVGQGKNGGVGSAAATAYGSGAGGGAGAVGSGGAGCCGGNGGVGLSNSISGPAVMYAGGGGGATYNGVGTLGTGGSGGGGNAAHGDGNPGTDGLGGGGGGAGGSVGHVGGRGGSGIVIVRYLTPASQQWLPNFSYREPIIITNPAGADVTNYQVLVTVPWNSHMQADFDDLRFTSQDGFTLLNYWLESKVDSTSARVWVKIPAVLASSSVTIYMYYGNSAAVSASSGTNTFLAYADFNTDEGFTIVDAGTTRAYGVAGTYVSTANHRVDFINLPSNTQTYIYKDYGASYFGDVIIEYNGMITGHGSASVSLAGLANELGATPYTSGSFATASDYVNDMLIYDWVSGTANYTSPYIQTQENTNFYVRFTVKPSASQSTLGVYSDSAMTTLFSGAWTNPVNLASPSVSLRYFYPLSSFGNSVAGRSITGWYDNFRVRKYLANPPTAGAPGTEQSIGASSAFTIKKNEGCSCVSSSECYSSACSGGLCSTVGVPGGQNLTATNEDYVANNSSYYCDKYFDPGNVLQTGGDGQISMSFNYNDTNAFANIAFYKVAIGTSSNPATASVVTDWIPASGPVGTLVTYTGTSVKIVPSALLYQIGYGDGTNRATYYWWIKVKNTFGGESADWIQASATFMAPKKHYPMVRVVSNRTVIKANNDIQYCSGTDLSNQTVPASRDACYSVCWTGTAGSAVVDPNNANWKCSVCYNSSATPVSCSTLNDGATAFTWRPPSAVSYVLVSGTLNSANPIIKYTSSTTGLNLKMGLQITGSACGNESGPFDIQVQMPTWREVSPF